MEGEREFEMIVELPQDVSVDFYKRFGRFLDEDLSQLRSLFCELLSLERVAFSLEIVAPEGVISDIEEYLNEHQYSTYCLLESFEKGDESNDYYPQELYDEFPNETIVWALTYVSTREEFVHLAELAEGLSCDVHEDCDPRAALRGLLYGYSIKNILGFIEQEEECDSNAQGR